MTPTFDKIKYATKLTASAAFSFFKINIIGTISIIMVGVITFMMLSKQCAGNGAISGHVSSIGLVIVILMMRPVATILTVGIFFAGPPILLALGNKYILRKTANKLIKEKGESLIFPLLEAVLNKVNNLHPELFKKGADKAKLKLKLLQAIKESNDNKWTKRIITIGLQKKCSWRK